MKIMAWCSPQTEKQARVWLAEHRPFHSRACAAGRQGGRRGPGLQTAAGARAGAVLACHRQVAPAHSAQPALGGAACVVPRGQAWDEGTPSEQQVCACKGRTARAALGVRQHDPALLLLLTHSSKRGGASSKVSRQLPGRHLGSVSSEDGAADAFSGGNYWATGK